MGGDRARWMVGAVVLFSSTTAFGQPGKSDSPKNTTPQVIRNLCFSPDGKQVAGTVGGPGAVFLWPVAGGKPRVLHREKAGIPGVAFSPDGKFLAIGTYENEAKLIDVAKGKVHESFSGHSKAVRAVVFAPDGRTLLTGGWDMSVKLWDLATGKLKDELDGYGNRIYFGAISPDGRKFAVGGVAPEAKVWDLRTGKLLASLRHDGQEVRAVSFVDNEQVISGGYDNAARIWNIATGKQVAELTAAGRIESIAYSQQTGTLAVCGYDPSIGLFDLRPPRDAEAKDKKEIDALLVKLDDERYADREAAYHRLKTIGAPASAQLREAVEKSKSAEVRFRAELLLESLRERKTVSLTGHEGTVETVVFSRDGRYLASAGKDALIKVWDMGARKELATLRQ